LTASGGSPESAPHVKDGFMAKVTRAEFLGLSGLLAGAAIGRGRSTAPGASVSAGPFAAEPDFVVVNARVYTIDDKQPRAEAFAVRDGKFIAVGRTGDVRNLAGRRTRIVDAGQMTVTPGFIDTHCHPSGVNELYEVSGDVRTVKALQQALRERAAKTPPGHWVNAFMFDDTKLDMPLHRRHLDEAVPGHPVSVNHRGGHTSWYNSKAFELVGITRLTRDPEHGRFFRDETGELSGRVAELARNVFANVGKADEFTPEQSRERARNGMVHISERLTAAGLTTVHDAGAGRARLLAYEDAYRAGGLRHRAYLMIRGADIISGLKAAGVYTGFGNEWIKIGGLKYAADGSASERTMRMSTPYVGTNDYGILTMTQVEIEEAVEDGHRHSFQVGIHANGDIAIDMVLKAYERVLKAWPDPNRRHRIEHCTLVNPELLERIKACGCIPTPFWTYVYYHGEKWSQYGDDKLGWMFAHRSFLDIGIPVPGASDYGPGPFEPLMALQSMVTRRDYKGREWGPNQKVTVDEALKIATINGARASFEEDLKGSITAGKLADFVLLEKDPHDVDPGQLKDIKVAQTVVGGKTMYPKSATQ
jgi:predicted amidohydrolase YtcJ